MLYKYIYDITLLKFINLIFIIIILNSLLLSLLLSSRLLWYFFCWTFNWFFFSCQVYQQVAKLFQNQEDLLQEFSQFLPDANGGQGSLSVSYGRQGA